MVVDLIPTPEYSNSEYPRYGNKALSSAILLITFKMFSSSSVQIFNVIFKKACGTVLIC